MTIAPADFQSVTPDATAKTRFVIVDALGITEHDFVEPPLNRDKGVSLKKLLDKAAAPHSQGGRSTRARLGGSVATDGTLLTGTHTTAERNRAERRSSGEEGGRWPGAGKPSLSDPHTEPGLAKRLRRAPLGVESGKSLDHLEWLGVLQLGDRSVKPDRGHMASEGTRGVGDAADPDTGSRQARRALLEFPAVGPAPAVLPKPSGRPHPG